MREGQWMPEEWVKAVELVELVCVINLSTHTCHQYTHIIINTHPCTCSMAHSAIPEIKVKAVVLIANFHFAYLKRRVL